MSDDLCVLLHGGAGTLKKEHASKKVPALSQALEEAWKPLCEGKPAEHAVVAALRVMENDEHFNAGFGGYPNVHGIVLLDIGLMTGDRSFISLLNLRRVKYPSAVALDMMKNHKALMTVWTHELMNQVDTAAPFIKERYGWVASHEELIAPFVQRMIDGDEDFEVTADANRTGGTVGCIVRDVNGRVAAGTSTGGVRLKFNGRIGDSPIIGSGVFADNEIGCFSTTGHGESLLGSMLSGFVIGEMRSRLKSNPDIFVEQPELLKQIVDNETDEMERKMPGKGGAIIVIPPRGQPAYSFNSQMVSLGIRTGTSKNIDQSDAFIVYDDGSKLREQDT